MFQYVENGILATDIGSHDIVKIAVLSFTSGKVNRGVETAVNELSKRWKDKHRVWVVDCHGPRGSILIKKLLQWKPDIVMPFNRGWQAVWVRLFCFITGAKMVVSGQAGYKDRQSLFVRPDLFIALTERNAKWARKYSFGVKVKVIPNGVDLDKFKPEGKKLKINLPRPIILCVAGGEKYKQVEETIRAVAQLKFGSLLLVGGSKDQEDLGEKMLPNRFMRKKFSHNQMPSVYRSADVFTLASKDSEAFGICYLEALASGLPVVAPDDQLRREILGKHGIYVKDVTVHKEYAKKLQKAIKQPKYRPINWLNSYNWDSISNRYLKLFNKHLLKVKMEK